MRLERNVNHKIKNAQVSIEHNADTLLARLFVVSPGTIRALRHISTSIGLKQVPAHAIVIVNAKTHFDILLGSRIEIGFTLTSSTIFPVSEVI